MVDSQQLLAKLHKQDRESCDEVLLLAIDNWTKQIEEIEAIRAVTATFVIERILDDFRSEIKNIDDTLLTKRKKDGLTEFDREVLLEKKMMYTKFVHYFDADEKLERIANEISKNI